MRRKAEIALAGLVACAFAACTGSNDSSSTDPPCVTGLTASCQATYAPPTFDTIFTNIFQTSCAVGVGTCHTADFGAGGIVFASEDNAYATLLGTNGGTAYVLPDNPGCSTLMKRLESTDPNYHMPRGPNSLSAGDLCTIVQWISSGAAR